MIASVYMTCDAEVIVGNNFTSSPHPLVVFGRDVFVLVKAKNLQSIIRIVIKAFFNGCNYFTVNATIRP